MPPILPGSVDARNKFEDLSGVDTRAFSNPYDALIEACQDDPKQIQSRYSTHRTARNAKQRADLLSPEFKGLILDGILQKLEDLSLEPGFVDPRNSLVFWARPQTDIRDLVSQIQQRLRVIAPGLWLMPLPNLHMTALEVTHSLTAPEVSAIVQQISPVIEKMTDYPYTHRSRLIKPLLSYDSAAIALSFLPAAGEGLSPEPSDQTNGNSMEATRQTRDDIYTYHHLRRDLFSLSTSTSLKIESRYVVPSAHITVGRFLTQNDHDSPSKMQKWIDEIESINEWLEREYWPVDKQALGHENGKEGGVEPGIRDGGEWLVGQGMGLDLREGRLWYGGGTTIRLGKGF